MGLPVVRQLDDLALEGFAVQDDAPNAALRLTRVLYANAVSGPLVAIGYLVPGPGGRDARVQRQPVALHLQAEDGFQHHPVEPACRTSVPGPATAAGVGWLAVHVGCYHVGLHPVT